MGRVRAPTWPPRGRTADAALALAAFAIVVAGTLLNTASGVERGLVPWAGWLLLVITCGSLYWRRAHPVPVLLLSLAACAVYYPLSEPDGPIMLVFVFALYNAAARGRVRTAAIVGAVSMAITAFGEVGSEVNHLEDAALWLMGGWFVAVVAVGGVVHNRRAYLREAERRALAAEHGREEEARRRATEERLRIAREVHDVLGHNISLINVQATAALHRGDPVRNQAALEAIKQASKETLRELRTTLGMLRQVDEEAPIAPAPGIARLDELAERAAAAGPAVRIETEGEPRPLPAETDLAVYRIVQEALTNVTRHSDATAVTVRIRHTGSDVRLEIDDDGSPVPAAAPGDEPENEPENEQVGTGSGLAGMRDRAEALGGTLDAGPAEDGGYRIRARLPVPPVPAA
jgi:signal transduction histidine kinase